MNKTHGILLGVLAAQIALAALTWSTGGGLGGRPDPEPLLGFEKGAVTALEITERPTAPDDEAETIRLEKSGDGWVVASAGGFPAKADKVDELVEKLVGIEIRRPVATRKASHNSLRVGEDVWGKKVKITAGGETKELVVGSGPGSTIHVRFAGADEVHRARGVTEYSISARVGSYVETQYVNVETDKLNEIQVTNAHGTLTFRKEGDQWALAELPAGRELDQSKVKSFASSVARLSLKEPVGKEVKPEYGLDGGTKVVLVATVDDKPKTVTYTVGAEVADANAHYVKADDQDFVVLVSDWATKSAREKRVDDFLVKEEPAAEASN